MKFNIYRTSDHIIFTNLDKNDSNEKEFNTLEELLKWIEEIGKLVIIDAADKTIEIYDDYRE